jgi:Flp pilus assembly protein CpaB
VGIAVRREGNEAATVAMHDGTGARPLARRRRLPSGRAVVGGLLVALAALAAFVAAKGNDRGPTHSYVVAAHDLVAGTRLDAADVRTVAMDLPDGVAGRAFTDLAAVTGRVTVSSLADGELIQVSTVVAGDAADPRYQLSVPVERSRALDGLVSAGELVDVMATYGTGGDGETLVVVRGAEVLRVDQGQRGALTSGNDLIILLAVRTADDALAVTHAAQAGKVTLVRSTAVPSVDGPTSYRPPTGKNP